MITNIVFTINALKNTCLIRILKPYWTRLCKLQRPMVFKSQHLWPFTTFFSFKNKVYPEAARFWYKPLKDRRTQFTSAKGPAVKTPEQRTSHCRHSASIPEQIPALGELMDKMSFWKLPATLCSNMCITHLCCILTKAVKDLGLDCLALEEPAQPTRWVQTEPLTPHLNHS